MDKSTLQKLRNKYGQQSTSGQSFTGVGSTSPKTLDYIMVNSMAKAKKHEPINKELLKKLKSKYIKRNPIKKVEFKTITKKSEFKPKISLIQKIRNFGGGIYKATHPKLINNASNGG